MFNIMVNFLRSRHVVDREGGFTLVEVMTVVLLLGIILAIAVPRYLEQQKVAHRAQVQTDVASTVTAFTNWQMNQSEYRAVPSQDVFDSKIKVVSNDDTKVTFVTANWGDVRDRAFCVQGLSEAFGERFVTHYSLQSKTAGEGECPAFTAPDEEVYN